MIARGNTKCFITKAELSSSSEAAKQEAFPTPHKLAYTAGTLETSHGNYVGMMLLDVQKAFDSVNNDILCDKLEAMGISSGRFRSYLFNRKQLVCTDVIKSSLQTITCGVPQGSLLGPLLYLCYRNEMELSVQNKLLLYADDSVIIAYDRDPNVVADMLGS